MKQSDIKKMVQIAVVALAAVAIANRVPKAKKLISG